MSIAARRYLYTVPEIAEATHCTQQHIAYRIRKREEAGLLAAPGEKHKKRRYTYQEVLVIVWPIRPMMDRLERYDEMDPEKIDLLRISLIDDGCSFMLRDD